MVRKGILIVVSGFSGAGKGTLMKKLVQTYDNYALSISMTTRPPREGEVDGREYFFVSRERFEEAIDRDGFVEHACYLDNYYGTPVEYVERELASGKDVVLEIEIQGAMKVKERFPSALLLFVMPPNIPELERRLIGRGTESKDNIEKRLKRAREEAEGIEQYEYIVVNDDLEQCVRQLHSIVEAAHAAPFRNRSLIQKMREELDSCYIHRIQI
ncbi:MAG: guanylate kinase [Lachnospiraceae bacterium]|jgi:guanylate kinase|nr:guanylate kinase [Lachnospiraceae bacterium]